LTVDTSLLFGYQLVNMKLTVQPLLDI